jgi:hypothetical protein
MLIFKLSINPFHLSVMKSRNISDMVHYLMYVLQLPLNNYTVYYISVNCSTCFGW